MLLRLKRLFVCRLIIKLHSHTNKKVRRNIISVKKKERQNNKEKERERVSERAKKRQSK